VPLFLVVAVIADAFAGERERHTLETLLATRLPDRAILFGKIAAGVIHGGGISLACFLVGLVTTSVAQRQVVVPRPWVAAGVVASMLLGALAAASGGVLVSLRAGTVRQVQQTLSVVMMAVLFLPPLAGQLLPEETRRALAARLATLGPEVLFVLALVALAFLDAALLGAAMRRFRRARLGASLS
jgi:ABC-2 type transport system permease protein